MTSMAFGDETKTIQRDIFLVHKTMNVCENYITKIPLENLREQVLVGAPG
jgi:hypothetical protein